MSYDYDLFVIGAGSGGVSAARRIGKEYGARVAIAERDLVGGTCVIRGCVPKKLMVYASKFSRSYKDAVGYGWSPVAPEFDWGKLVTVVDHEVMRLNGIYKKMLRDANVELFEQSASLVDAHTIKLAENVTQGLSQRTVTAEKILIAVGGEAVRPAIPGVELTLTSREIFKLPQQPQKLAVIGAGYIAVEFAGIMQGLGTQVTQIIRGDKFLRGFDEDLRDGIYEGMIQKGIRILNHAHLHQIEEIPEGLKVTFKQTDLEISLVVDAVLMAIGRVPNFAGLGLENAGVEVVMGAHAESLPNIGGYTINSAIAVDEYSRTSVPHIFAVGDCTNRINLTPVAIAEGRAFADSEFGDNPRIPSHENVASAIFSQPEGASVGLTETQAREQLGDKVKIFRAKFRPMFQTLAGGEDKVTVKLVVDAITDRILGAHMVGDSAAEIMQGIAIAIKMGATKKDFDATIGIHPSTAEEFVTMR